MKKLIFTLGVILLFVGCQGNPTSPDNPAFKPLEIQSFTVSPAEILRGSSAVLSWETINARSVSIDQGIGEVEAAGSFSVSPEDLTAYTLTAQGMKGQVSRSVTVWVIQPKKGGRTWCLTR